MKRIISLFLVVVMIFNASTIALATSIPLEKVSDMVAFDEWSYEALATAVETGLIQGDSNQIRPYDNMTRAEMITIILRALGLDKSNDMDLSAFEADISSFSDINSQDWFYNEISMAYKLKLLEGVSNTQMSPNGIATREQAFTVLSRLIALNSEIVDTSVLNQFTDLDTLSSWAKKDVAAMVSAGFVEGNNNLLNPGDDITRQEFAQLMYNIFHSHYIRTQEEADLLSGSSISDNIIITNEDISLTDVTIMGDVIIGDGVGNGNVTLDHVTIDGRLIIRGGGENSIYLKNTTATTIIISKLSDGGIRVHGDEGSAISYIEIPDGKDTVVLECAISNLLITGQDLDIIIKKDIGNIYLSGDNTHISGTGNVENINLESGVKKVFLDIENITVTNNAGTSVSITDKKGVVKVLASDGKTTVNGKETTTYDNTGSISGPTDSSVTKYTLSFHTNDSSPVTLKSVVQGELVGSLPVPQKENSIFIGWFTDDTTFEKGISENTLADSDLDLYAKYIESAQIAENNLQTTTSVMDKESNYSITILSSDVSMTAEDVKTVITFDALSEEADEFAGISLVGDNGTYTLTALNGFTENCSYSLLLEDDRLTFEGEIGSVRTYNWSIKMAEPVLNLALDSSVKFIPVTEIDTITQNGDSVDSIFAPLYTMDDADSIDSIYGTFNYTGSLSLAIGDKLALYEGTAPEARVSTGNYKDEQISYVTITSITGTTIAYGDTDSSEIIFMPDVLPVNKIDDEDGDINNDSLTIAMSKMTYNDAASAEMGLDETTTIDPGDFIAFYVDSLETEQTVEYGEISEVLIVGTYYVIEYISIDETAVFSSMDMSYGSDLDYDQLSDSIALEDAEAEIHQQIVESGFANSATEFLKALAQTDEETQKEVCEALGIEQFTLSRGPSTDIPLSTASAEVDVKAKFSKNLTHYSGHGIHCEVTVTTEVELGDDMTLTISGTFVEEFKVTLNIDSKTIWKKKWIFPYIYDYQLTANLDLYNYTYLALDMSLTTNSSAGWSDELNIKDSIDKLKDITSYEAANDKVREFYETYQDMLEQEHGYIKLFDVQLTKITGGIDPFHILAYGLTVKFVVSLDADVALGAEFSYEKATRYTFVLKIKDKVAKTSHTELINEEYAFSAYAMGMLGVRAGINVTVEVGLIDVRIASVGVSAEVGAYWQIWGFVTYELKHKNNVTTSKSSGACYMEVGIYLSLKFVASVGNGKIASYKKALYDKTWPLWSAGSQYNIYDFDYVLTDNTDDIYLKGTSANYTLSSSLYKMARMDFKTGDISEKIYTPTNFVFTIKDDPYNAFSVSKTGVVTVKQPDKSDIASATLEVTWNSSPLSFTSVPISRTYMLTWDNLASRYSISFDTNNGSNVSSITGAYNKSITLPTPRKSGYTFAGWFTDNTSFENAFTETKMPAANYKLYAKWTAATANYSVRHYQEKIDGSGYDLITTDKFSATTETSVSPIVKTYDGFQAPSVQTATIKGDGSTVVSYYYDRKSYNVTFDPNDGTANIVTSLKYGSTILAPSLSQSGYTFTGWNSVVAATMPAGNLSYTAQWSLNTYTITYDLDGGSGTNATSFNVNTDTITLNPPTKTNFVFIGWTGSGLSSMTKTVSILKGTKENRYYTANWKVAEDTKYAVFHHREDSSGAFTMLEVETMTGVSGANTNAQAKTYDGYNSEAVTQVTITDDEQAIVNIYYIRIEYLLTFDANGGIGGSVSYVKHGAAITAPTVTRSGYTFKGWDTEVLSNMPEEVVMYTATWEAATDTEYSVSHYQEDLSGSYIIFETDFMTGTTGDLTNAQANTYTGFTAGTVTQVAIDADGNSSVSINYSRNSYTLTFDAAEGSGGSIISVKYGSVITAPTVTRSGYTFAGWDTDVLSHMPDNNVTYTATWIEATGVGIFEAKYSGLYQVFDSAPSDVPKNAFDASWGTGNSSTGHQFSDAMLQGRYFMIRKTGDSTYSYALYMYESDGTPVISGISENIPTSSLIGLESNVNLSANCKASLLSLYGNDWAQGLTSVGEISNLYDEGFKYVSKNGYGYYISGYTVHNTGSATVTNTISSPSLEQLEAISNYSSEPLAPIK